MGLLRSSLELLMLGSSGSHTRHSRYTGARVAMLTLLYLLQFVHHTEAAILNFKNIVDRDDPARSCSVHGRKGVCMFSMVCSFLGGRHLGLCRDRFIFGSCCLLPQKDGQSELQIWEQMVNDSPIESICGRPLVQTGRGRIQGGEVANRTDWPWQGGLRLGERHHCGAVLLNHHWVSTAAHCIYKKSMAKLRVRLGDYNNQVDVPEDGQEDRGVAEILLHPLYQQRNYDNDIALLRLDEPVAYSKYILPICIPDSTLSLVGKQGYVTGWGRIYDGGPRPSLLNQVDVPILSGKECNSLFRMAKQKDKVREDIWVCAGLRQGGKDACDGDSGGPMSVMENSGNVNVWYLAGIVSWGPNSCGERYKPGVYTRVPAFSRWIQNNIKTRPYGWTRTLWMDNGNHMVKTNNNMMANNTVVAINNKKVNRNMWLDELTNRLAVMNKRNGILDIVSNMVTPKKSDDKMRMFGEKTRSLEGWTKRLDESRMFYL